MKPDSDNKMTLGGSFSGSALKKDNNILSENSYRVSALIESILKWIVDSRSSRLISINIDIFEQYYLWQSYKKPYRYSSSVGISSVTLK